MEAFSTYLDIHPTLINGVTLTDVVSAMSSIKISHTIGLSISKNFENGYIGISSQRYTVENELALGGENATITISGLGTITKNTVAKTQFLSDPHWLLGIQGGINYKVTPLISLLANAKVLFPLDSVIEQKQTSVNLPQWEADPAPNLYQAAHDGFINAIFNNNGDMSVGLGDKISLYSLQLQAGFRVTPQTR